MGMREKMIEVLMSRQYGFCSYDQMADYLLSKDVVPVVRCKDCKWAEYGKDYEPYCNHWKSGLYADVKVDDFCSYGERKDNG